MLGARSTLETAVGSRPKLNTTSTSTTKTAAERIAVRERNSTSRSLEATVQAWRRSLGDCIAIVLAHLLGTSPGPRSEMREAARAHECDVGRELRTFIDIVGHQDGSAASALDLRPPALRQDQTRENFEEGGLPGAVRTEHRKRLAGRDAERNVVEGPDRTEAVP